MPDQAIDFRVVEIALERADGASFEKFAQSFYAAVHDTDFVPLGGMHDGGAEGFDGGGLFEDTKPERYLQASIRADTRTKIRQTVKRLREFGRSPKALTYLTSVVVPLVDTEEELLSDEFDIQIRIRDAKYISVHINDSIQTIRAFRSYLEPHLDFLREIGAARTIGTHSSMPARTLCVFLGQELERRRGNTELLEAVTDSLILWALEGTDPDKGIFKGRAEILEAVEQTIPAARQFFRGELDVRLERLASKDHTDGRAVRWYRKDDKFCLPLETREIVERENTEDEVLRLEVSDQFRIRATEITTKADNQVIIDKVIQVCHRTIELAFETQGLEMAYFVTEDEPVNYVKPAISEILDKAIDDLGLFGPVAGRVAEIALSVLRATFYDSSEVERSYLGKLSRTYVLMFVLKNEPKIVEYFRSMSSEFVLYVGTDMFIRAISEYYLRQPDKMTSNALEIISATKSVLIVTEKCVEEVWTHLKATDYEFINHYAEMEKYIDIDLARSIDRILIRSYLYSKLDPQPGVSRPSGWAGYIGNFCEYKDLHSERGRDQVREYLIARFSLEYESEAQMLSGVDGEELKGLTKRILNERWHSKHPPEKEELLARNDALHVLRVYAKRNELNERNHANPYGFKTWWLTYDAHVRRATGPEVIRHHGRYMMRPEFLLNFISLSPSEDSVRKSFSKVFPTLLGVKLSNRISDGVFKAALSDIASSFAVDEARARVRLSDLADQLKSDFFKQYH